MENTLGLALERAKTPESVGVCSKEVQAFVNQCLKEGRELHSIMVLRHGKVACEAYRAPYSPEYRHMMYSVSKSFTSTAVGFAIEEGYFSLDTKFCEIFPEALKINRDPRMEKMTVEDLLTMRAGLNVSPMFKKGKERWLEGVLKSPFYAEPGAEFRYISENMYLLCCIIHKTVGTSVMQFLKPRLFDPLGIENPFWETDPAGIEAGGWGLMITTEDLAKFILCYRQGGIFCGKQVVPEWWTREATKFHAENAKANLDIDMQCGYGYCFWRNGVHKTSYRADGMFSQFAIAFEEVDACVIVTGGEVHLQPMRDVIWNHFPKAFIDDDPNAESAEISISPYPILPKKPRSALERRLIGKTMHFRRPALVNIAGYPISVVPFPALVVEGDKAGNISNVKIVPRENDLVLSWSEGDEVNSIAVGMDGNYRKGEIVIGKIAYNTLAVGAWNSETELEIHIRPMETVAERILKFSFSGSAVSMKPSELPDTAVMGDSLKTDIKMVIKQPLLQSVMSKAFETVIPHFLDSTHIGIVK